MFTPRYVNFCLVVFSVLALSDRQTDRQTGKNNKQGKTISASVSVAGTQLINIDASAASHLLNDLLCIMWNDKLTHSLRGTDSGIRDQVTLLPVRQP